MKGRLTVGIVGCGVAGAASAVLLRRAGHAVTVFERAAVVGPAGAGILLQPSGQAVLSRMGLLNRVIAQAEPIDRLYAQTHYGRRLVDLPYGEVGPGAIAYGLHRGDLFRVLHAELLECGAELRLESEVTSPQEGRLKAFDLILAADGARSAMRSNSQLVKSVYEYPHAAVWAVGTCKAVQRRLFQVTRGTKQLCGLLPTGNGRCSLFWSLPLVEKAAFLTEPFARWRDQVLKLCPLAQEMFESVRSHQDLRITGYWHVTMPRWHDNRMVVIGDAAHAMSPHLGQGVNLALLDAECLATCLQSAETVPQALNDYEKHRRRQIRFYSCITRMLSPFFQSRGIVKGVGRDLCLPILPHLPIIRRQMLRTMSGLKNGYLH